MTVIAVDRDSAALTLTIVSEFGAPVERVWQVWADPRQLPRDRRRPRSDQWRPGHLLHDRARRREAPRLVANHLGRCTQVARVRGGVRPTERGPAGHDGRGSASRDAREDHHDDHHPIRFHRGHGAAARNREGRGDKAGGRTDRCHPCNNDCVLIASYTSARHGISVNRDKLNDVRDPVRFAAMTT